MTKSATYQKIYLIDYDSPQKKEIILRTKPNTIHIESSYEIKDQNLATLTSNITMARPPNLNAWGTGWNHAALVPAYGAMYAQQAQQYRHPYMTVTQPTTTAPPSMSAALSAAIVAPLKRKLTEVEEATSGANKNDHHILWMRAYDKPMPEFLKNKCKPLYCELCSVNLNSIIQAKMHYEGKGHEKKVRFALQTWAKENDTVPPKKGSSSTKQTVEPVIIENIYGPSPTQRPRYDFPSYTSHARHAFVESDAQFSTMNYAFDIFFVHKM